jgi:hypothetical protein
MLRRLPSVLNAAARTITSFSAYQYDACWPPLTPSCCTHQIQTGDSYVPLFSWYGPHYLSANFIWVADVPAHRRVRSSTTDSLIVRRTRLVTVGDRAFSVVGANLWNSLSDYITSLDSQITFRRQLKTSLPYFFPDFCC